MSPCIYFLLLAACVVSCTACMMDFECPQCHTCDSGVCHPVPIHTDPNDECPIKCDVKMLCGPRQICVFKDRPTCQCDWMEGVCVDQTPVPVELPPIETLHAMGMSDDDIKMTIEQIRNEQRYYHRNQHKDHFHISSEDSAAAHDFILIANIIMSILSVAVIVGAVGCMWRTLLKREELLANKKE